MTHRVPPHALEIRYSLARKSYVVEEFGEGIGRMAEAVLALRVEEG